MKQFFPFLVLTFFLSAVSARATFIVYGTISGTVTQTDGLVRTTVGDSITGYFSYDYDLLSPPDLSGNRTVSSDDPNATFYFSSSVGEKGGAGNDSFGEGNLSLIVDANGLPESGGGVGFPDIGIGASYVALSYGADIGWLADVTYTITSMTPVPDAGATWFLLGIGLAGVVAFGRFFRRTPV